MDSTSNSLKPVENPDCKFAKVFASPYPDVPTGTVGRIESLSAEGLVLSISCQFGFPGQPATQEERQMFFTHQEAAITDETPNAN